MRSRPRPLVIAVLTATAALASAVVPVLAAPSKPIVVRDARGDVTGTLDLQRFQLSLEEDRRLRAVVTFAGKVTAADMLARSGPPGSVCLRVWTAEDADPAAARPDRLVCVTARTRTALRATVLRQDGPGLPQRVGSAAITASKSDRSLIIRFAQSDLGAPQRIRYGLESTRRGCQRPSCVDRAPGGPATRRFRLR